MSTSELTSRLSAEQRRVVETVDGPVLVYAGPGSGKTRVVTHRIAEQVRHGARPATVVAVTFTDKAASELLARLRGLGVPAGRGGVRASTFHSAALRQVSHFWPLVTGGERLDVVASKVPLLLPIARRTREDAGDLAAEIEWVKAHGARLDGVPGEEGLPDQLAELSLSGDAPRWTLDVDAYARARPDRDAAGFARTLDRYEEAKVAANALDFEDMLAVARALIVRHDDVATAVRGALHRFTVDEFQDVNRLQWDLLSAWLGDRDDICIVGDDDQAIYGFSGASPRYLERFRSRYGHATVVTLLDNHRSTQPILDAAGQALWKRGKRKTLHAVRGDGPSPVLSQHTDEDGERRDVIGRCRELAAAGTDWQEMAVLYRFNAQSEAWEEAFAAADIPYVVRGDQAFFERRHVRQALTVLDQALRTGADQPPADDPRVLLDGAEPAQLELDRLVPRLFRERLSWTEREPTGGQARERWADWNVLVDLARGLHETDPEASLEDYLADLRRRADLGRAPDGGGVNLLTLHRAKGLEFDAVFVVSCEEGRVPSRFAVEDDERLGRDLGHPDSAVAEESRLLYVGMTRARTHLHVSWVSRGVKRRSRFLKDLVEGNGQAVEVVGARTGKAAKQPARRVDRAFLAGPLGEALREWRLRTANDAGVPAFVVFSDATLGEIVERRPSSRSQLLEVPGVGKAKLERYGDDVLAIVSTAPGS